MIGETYESAIRRARTDPLFHRMVSSFIDIFERMDLTPGDVHAAYMVARNEWERRHPQSNLCLWPKEGNE